MTNTTPTVLHAIDARFAGESAAFAPRAHDPVLVLGHARDARAISQLLGRPVQNAPRPASGRARSRVAERARVAAGATTIFWHCRGSGNPGSDDPESGDPGSASTGSDRVRFDAGRLPSRDTARRALGLGSELVLAPLADRPASVDARTLLFITGVIEIIGERIAVALPAAARRLDEAMTYHRAAGLVSPCRIVDDAWLCAIPAADVLIAPVDAEDDPASSSLRTLAEDLGIPVATTAAWHLDADAATNSLPAEIRATVTPVLERARLARSGGAPAPATVSA